VGEVRPHASLEWWAVNCPSFAIQRTPETLIVVRSRDIGAERTPAPAIGPVEPTASDRPERQLGYSLEVTPVAGEQDAAVNQHDACNQAVAHADVDAVGDERLPDGGRAIRGGFVEGQTGESRQEFGDEAAFARWSRRGFSMKGSTFPMPMSPSWWAVRSVSASTCSGSDDCCGRRRASALSSTSW
jgi:hypothetical protein